MVNTALLVFANNIFQGDQFLNLENYSTAFFWGIGLFFHWFGVFGRNFLFTKQWEERKIKEFMDKN